MSLKQRLSLVTLGPAKTDQCCQASDIKIGQWILCFYHEESFSWLLFSQQLFQCSALGSATNLTFHKYLDHQYWDQMEQCDLYATELHFAGLESDRAKRMCLSFLSWACSESASGNL